MMALRILRAPTGGHLLAERAARAEKLLALGDSGRAFSDHFGLKIGDYSVDLTLRQLGSRRRRLLVADLRLGHPETLLALGPGEPVEMRHCRAARDAAADHLDQLIMVELGLAQ